MNQSELCLMAILRYRGIRGSENFYLKIKKNLLLLTYTNSEISQEEREDTRSAILYVYHILPQKFCHSATYHELQNIRTTRIEDSKHFQSTPQSILLLLFRIFCHFFIGRVTATACYLNYFFFLFIVSLLTGKCLTLEMRQRILKDGHNFFFYIHEIRFMRFMTFFFFYSEWAL